jgi:hypothetical protein
MNIEEITGGIQRIKKNKASIPLLILLANLTRVNISDKITDDNLTSLISIGESIGNIKSYNQQHNPPFPFPHSFFFFSFSFNRKQQPSPLFCHKFSSHPYKSDYLNTQFVSIPILVQFCFEDSPHQVSKPNFFFVVTHFECYFMAFFCVVHIVFFSVCLLVL